MPQESGDLQAVRYTEAMHRVYFNANERPGAHAADERFALNADLSAEDMARIPGGPRDGLRVLLYDAEDIEVEAVLAFDPGFRMWMGDPDFSTLINLSEPTASGSS